MRSYNVVLLPGDGIGPEISNISKLLLNKVSKLEKFEINFIESEIGGSAIEATGEPLPIETLKRCKESDAVLLAAIGSPKYDSLPREKRPETGLLQLRAGLGLFANIRPVKIRPSLIDSSTLKPAFISDVDLVVVRELIGGIYFGTPKGRVESNGIERAFNTMSYDTNEIKRIGKIAFDIAKIRRKKVCSVDKANVLDVSQLWRDEIESLSKEYTEIQLKHLYVDNAAMQLVKEPSQFDVILTSNLFGDILSDQAAMLSGSIGMLPSASLSENGPGVFEPVHGSAPDIAGQDKANPLAMLLSAAMMLRIGLKEQKAADLIEKAVDRVLEKGLRTSDLMNKSSKEIGCSEMGEELLKAI